MRNLLNIMYRPLTMPGNTFCWKFYCVERIISFILQNGKFDIFCIASKLIF